MADVAPGHTVLGRVFVSPATSSKVYNAFDVKPRWSREFSGSGTGTIPGRSSVLKELDNATTTTVSAMVLAATAAFLAL